MLKIASSPCCGGEQRAGQSVMVMFVLARYAGLILAILRGCSESSSSMLLVSGHKDDSNSLRSSSSVAGVTLIRVCKVRGGTDSNRSWHSRSASSVFQLDTGRLAP